MASQKYLAHKSEDNRSQTVLEHLNGTADLCARFAAAFGAEDQGRLAGLTHDIGKYSDAFQRRLNNGPKVDHSTAGAFECCKAKQLLAAFVVAGHHSGLPDGGSRTNSPDESTFLARMNLAGAGKLEPYDAWRQEVTLPRASFPALGHSQAEGMFFTRMLYSCLVDADYLDTEAFMAGQPADRGGVDSMEDLERKLQAYISDWFHAKEELNRQRCAILRCCQDQGETQKPGLFTLTVPTGGGKTTASLAFALRHARVHGLHRVIYVIPYTSIIEQNAGKFRDILGAENVLEHHSGVLYNIDDEADPETSRLARATENWDLPVVVTTAVQFFESLFSSRSSKCRKLHNLAGSVIIFDEAQMLPLPYLRPCIFAIAQLVKHYGVSAVLCTATQPFLGPLFREFLPEKAPVELCPPDTYDSHLFRRVTYRREGSLTSEVLSQRLNALPQVLCVVNLRKIAQEIFRSLDQDGAFHLSTLMYPTHRKTVLEKIKTRLKEDLPCRVVSTSLIEAGVDVDFPRVFREEAGLDSIIQAAGRCNREGKRPVEESIVNIFHMDGPSPLLFRQNIRAGQAALDHVEQPDSPEAISRYFEELLVLNGNEGQDVDGILSLMEDPYILMPFREVDRRFKLIRSGTHTVYIPREQGAGLVEQLRAGVRSRALFRALGQYGVSVYPDHFSALDRAGALELLEDGSAILIDPDLYDESTGLSLDVGEGKGYIL